MVQQFSGGTQTDRSTYVYDALDRTTIEHDDHTGTANDRKTEFTYQGLSGLLTEERQSGGTAPKTTAYSYDNFGHKLGMSNTDNGTGAVENFSYRHRRTRVDLPAHRRQRQRQSVLRVHRLGCVGLRRRPIADRRRHQRTGTDQPHAPLQQAHRLRHRHLDWCGAT
jgi:hypothetical protein